jgi:hypothetical protein
MIVHLRLLKTSIFFLNLFLKILNLIYRLKDTDCKGYKFPDAGGHYRNPKLTQIKHHWWWKVYYFLNLSLSV